MARDITVKALSKNLLQKYGLGKKVSEEEEGGDGAQGSASGSGAKPKGKGAVGQTGRKAMTDRKKDMIKGGSFIALGHQGTL